MVFSGREGSQDQPNEDPEELHVEFSVNVAGVLQGDAVFRCQLLVLESDVMIIRWVGSRRHKCLDKWRSTGR